MTPLIQKAVKFSPEPEKAMWFDVGQMQAEQNKLIPVESVFNLPYPITGIAGIDSTGKDFCLWLIQGEDSIVVGGGSMYHNKYFEPYAYAKTDEKITLYRKDKEIKKDEVMPVHRMVIATLDKLSSVNLGYRATPKDTFINKKRQAKGKNALTFEWHTVEIEPAKQKLPHQGGTHASPRLHDRRGHYRNHPSGKRIWVRACKVGSASNGVIFKDYKFKDEE
jgi:hypothetical protein